MVNDTKAQQLNNFVSNTAMVCRRFVSTGLYGLMFLWPVIARTSFHVHYVFLLHSKAWRSGQTHDNFNKRW